MNYVLTYIKEGLGNKVYILANMIYFFLELRKLNPDFVKMYVGIAISHHEKGKGQIDDFRNIFPNTLTYDWLEFIEDETFDKLKKECTFIEQKDLNLKKVSKIETPLWIKANYNMSLVPFNKYYKLFENIFSVNPELLNLQYNYDYENDIFIHIRYGDKVELVKKGRTHILLMTPQFYREALNLMKISSKSGKVYIFTDSPEIVREKIFPKEIFSNFIITSEPSYVVFHLAKMFKHIIMTDSSLTQTGAIFNENPKKIISFAYANLTEDRKHNPNFYWPDPYPFTFVYNKKYHLGINPLNKDSYTQLTNLDYLLDKTKIKMIEF
jgi:hypothetical protein